MDHSNLVRCIEVETKRQNPGRFTHAEAGAKPWLKPWVIKKSASEAGEVAQGIKVLAA